MDLDQNKFDPKDTLIKDLGLDSLPEDKKNNLIVTMAQALQNRITVRVLDVLSEGEKKEMDTLIAGGDDSKVEEFMATRVPGIDSIIKDEYETFRTEMVQQNEALKNAIKEVRPRDRGRTSFIKTRSVQDPILISIILNARSGLL